MLVVADLGEGFATSRNTKNSLYMCIDIKCTIILILVFNATLHF